jgi:hypothetical protein
MPWAAASTAASVGPGLLDDVTELETRRHSRLDDGRASLGARSVPDHKRLAGT